MNIDQRQKPAIVIPAYKGIFLKETLASLANQSCKDFKVYIGNDGSNDDIESIAAAFSHDLNIQYKYFEDNLGHKSLTSHWQRCIDMVGEEEWIWILPDDDTASPECISAFIAALQEDKGRLRLYRFNTDHIDSVGIQIKINAEPPALESNVDFVFSKLRFERSSSLAEYIFSKKKFAEVGGFKDLPLAWGSDDLLWINLSQDEDIVTMPAGMVHLRQSAFNISGDNEKYKQQKFEAKYKFLKALLDDHDFIKKMQQKYSDAEFKEVMTDHIFYEYKSHALKLSITKMFQFAALNSRVLGGGYLKNLYRLIRFKIRNAA